MKTSIHSKIAGASLGPLFSALISTNAMAGPGIQYWQSLGKAKDSTSQPSRPAFAPTILCADAKVVPVTVMRPAWANGKGPLVAVQVGTKTVCHICPVTIAVAKSAWQNGRGPLTTTKVTKTGVEHLCMDCAEVAPKS